MPYNIVIVGLFLFGYLGVVNADQNNAKILLSQFRQFSAVTEQINKNIPLRIQSRETKRRLHVDVFGIISHPFSRVVSILSKPANMCDFLILNLNVKTCTYGQESESAGLMIYVSSKNYRPLFLSLKIDPYFELQKKNKNYMRVLMASRKSAWGIKDYSVIVEAAPYGKSTLVRFTSRYHASRVNMAATTFYLKTIARNKVGFTVADHNRQGEPQYVRGMRGVIERNAVRSHLALQAYLETDSVPNGKRFEARLRRWFELTEVYPQQLHEMQWKSYLRNKRREYRNQRKLQLQISRQAEK